MEATNLAEIEQERESISMAIISLKLYNKEITQENLEAELKKQSGHTASKVDNIGDGNLLVFFPCKRVYVVEKNGDVKYIGKEDEINEIYVIADKESDLNSKQVQAVKITVKRYNADENEKITIQYAWNQNKTDEPKTYKNATLEEGTTISIIESGEQPTGNYYLWVKVKVGNTEEIKRTYGEYYIQEYTTLVSTYNENSADSGFLGNIEIQRGNIKSITLTNSIEGKEVGKDNCWDAGNKKVGVVLAWYTTEEIDGETYYNVTIGQEGGVIANANSSRLFSYIGYNFTEEVEIKGLENLDTSNVIRMLQMFNNCKGLINIDVSKFDTSGVTDMAFMFQDCEALMNLNVSNFDTSNVISMQCMFNNCKGLTSLDVSKFDTSSVTNMYRMFNNCEKLTNLDVSKFETSNVTTMFQMFCNCKGLSNLDVSKFNTNNVTNMYGMFFNCEELESLDVSKFNTSNVTTMQSMFEKCRSLTNLDVSGFNTSSVTSMYRMFESCVSLTSLDVSNFDTSNVTTMFQMFYNCKALTNLDLRNWVIAEGTTVTSIINSIPNDCDISVSTQEMVDWVKSQNSKLTNVNIVK